MILIKPISVNECWQGRRFRTKEFKEWQVAVIYAIRDALEMCEVKNNYPMTSEKIHLKLKLYLKCPLRSDADNYQKPIIDCLVKAGIIKDDRYIFQITTTKEKSEREGFDFSLMDCE